MSTLAVDKKVMVVEDESIISLDIKNSLIRLGYAVSGIAASGDAALRKIYSNLPDLVLMDIHLKGDMTGIEVSEKIKSIFHIPVVYLTANADTSTFQEAKQTSPYGYLLKPFAEKELGIAIEIALHKHQQEQTIRSSESWYASAFQSINEAVVATDLHGDIVFMNAFAEAITGWQLMDVVDKPLVEILAFQRKIQQFDHIELKESISSILNAALRGSQAVSFPYGAQLLTKSLEALPVEGDAAAIRDATGRVTGSIFIFRDAQETPWQTIAAPGTYTPQPIARISSVSLLTEQSLADPASKGGSDQGIAKEQARTSKCSNLSLEAAAPGVDPELNQSEQQLTEDTALIRAFTKAFIGNQPILASTSNLIASAGDGLTTLSDRAEGMIVKVTTVRETLTAIVKQHSRYWPLIRHVLIENSFFPVSRRTNGHCYYQHHHIPDQCQIYHTGGAELWEAWHGRTKPGQKSRNIPSLKLPRENIIVLRRGSWYHIQNIVIKATGLHIKTVGGEIFVTPDDSLVWGTQNWPYSG